MPRFRAGPSVSRRLTEGQWIAGITLGALAGLAAVLCFVRPGDASWLPRCPFHQFTGLYCPGCGTTRMLYLLVHGHPLLALRENALSLMVVPIAVCSLVRQLAGGRTTLSPGLTSRLSTAFAVVLILFTVTRNIPVEPFRLLAPQPLSAFDLPLR